GKSDAQTDDTFNEEWLASAVVTGNVGAYIHVCTFQHHGVCFCFVFSALLPSAYINNDADTAHAHPVLYVPSQRLFFFCSCFNHHHRRRHTASSLFFVGHSHTHA